MSLFRRKEGTRAQAQILEMAPTPKGVRQTGKLDVEYRFRLAVTTTEGSRFEAEHVCNVPHAKMPLPNDTLPVEIDEQQVLRVVWKETPDIAERARQSAAAAQRGDDAGAAQALGFQLRDPEP